MSQGLASRILRFPLTRLVLGIVFAIAPVLAVQIPLRAKHLEQTRLAFSLAILAALLCLGGYRLYVWLVERRAATELAAAGAAVETAAGMALGAALFCAVIAILASAGAYTMGERHAPAVLLVPLAGSIVSAVVEEILFRGILFRIIESSLGTWMALLVSAALFGLAHLSNPGSGLVPAASIIVEAGILLAAAYMLTRRLWLPIGLHFAWNFTEAGVFGADVSGRKIEGLFAARFTGPAWLTGGSFGPEASVVAVGLCLAAGVTLLVLASRRGRWMPPFWLRPSDVATVAEPAVE